MGLYIKKVFFPFLLVLIFTAPASFAQADSFDKADKEFAALYTKIFPFYYGNRDSLNYYSDLFSTRFKTFIRNSPATIDYKFKSLTDSNACKIVTSPDRQFRIYSWDTWLGGTMHDVDNIVQFRSEGKVYSTGLKKSRDDFYNFFTAVFTLKANGTTYYLTTGMGSESTRYGYETIRIFTISNGTVNDSVKLIKTPGGLNNAIGFEYDFFTVVDRTERPIRLIRYDTNKRIIYIPIVLEDGKVTRRFIRYRFNGKYFCKISPT